MANCWLKSKYLLVYTAKDILCVKMSQKCIHEGHMLQMIRDVNYFLFSK